MRNYSVNGNKTNTASTTVPLVNLTGGTTVRPRIYDLIVGSDATPVDAAAKYAIQRASARGTQSTTITPQAIDSNDPAAVTTADDTWSVNPTLTASAFLLQFGLNNRATFRWVAAPGKELAAPATSGAGMALVCLVNNGGTYNAVYSIEFEE